MNRWFRFYAGVVDDPKAQMLAPELFKHWVNVLCIAAQHDGELPAISVTAFTLRMPEAKAAAILVRLHAAGMLDRTEASFKPHNWDRRQYRTDLVDVTNAQRQKNFRAKKSDELRELKALRDSASNALRNGKHNDQSNDANTVTAKRPDTETDNNRTTASLVETQEGLGNESQRRPDQNSKADLEAMFAARRKTSA